MDLPIKKPVAPGALLTEEMIELRPFYIDYLRNEINKFKSLLMGRDLDQIRELGHRLKGSGGTYGFHRISDLGETIQNLENAVDWKDVERLLMQLADLYDRIKTFQDDH